MKKEKKIHDRNTRNNEVAVQFILEECITRQISSLRGTVNCSFVKINEIQPKNNTHQIVRESLFKSTQNSL